MRILVTIITTNFCKANKRILSYLISYYCLVPGRIRVLYTDYEHLLVHECLQENDAGRCEDGQEAIVAYARTTAPLTPAVIARLEPIAHQACVRATDFVRVKHDGEFMCGCMSVKTQVVLFSDSHYILFVCNYLFKFQFICHLF